MKNVCGYCSQMVKINPKLASLTYELSLGFKKLKVLKDKSEMIRSLSWSLREPGEKEYLHQSPYLSVHNNLLNLPDSMNHFFCTKDKKYAFSDIARFNEILKENKLSLSKLESIIPISNLELEVLTYMISATKEINQTLETIILKSEKLSLETIPSFFKESTIKASLK